MRTQLYTRTPHSNLDYNAFCQCTADGSGNFYDFIPREPNQLAVSIGDLPSTGDVPSVTIPYMQALVRGLNAGSNGDVAGVAHELNDTIYLLGPRDLCAPWFFALIDSPRRELRYVNAGHEPPFLIRKHGGSVQRLERTGAALGLSARGIQREETATIEPGDLLAVFSEGMADILSDDGVLEVVLRNPHAGAVELTRRIFEEADRLSGRSWLDEDRTFAAVRVMDACERPLNEDHAEECLLVCAA